MSKQPKFVDGEKVLCYHGPLLYEAKTIKSSISKDKDKTIKYFIHYAGWNKNWDEWVPENRVLKYNDANVQKQLEVSRQHQNSATKTKKGAKSSKKMDGVTSKENDSRSSTPSKDISKETGKDTPTSSVSSSTSRSRSTPKTTVTATPSSSTANNGASSTSTTSTPNTTINTSSSNKESSIKSEEAAEVSKRKRPRLDNSVSNDQAAEGCDEQIKCSKMEIKIKIPDELKPWLVDDWEMINRQHKLVDLPAKMTVEQIIEEYCKKSTKSNTSNKEVSVPDVANGILEYFNVMLGSQLLYKVERPQYSEILKQHNGKKMSQIYGSVHLLRLFVKLGSVLAFTTLDDKSIQVLIGHLTDFLKYLSKNITTLFSTSLFVNSTSDYQRSLQSQ